LYFANLDTLLISLFLCALYFYPSHSSAADIGLLGKKEVQETCTPLTWKEEKWTDGQYLVLFLEFV
jgi:hypothetical protein